MKMIKRIVDSAGNIISENEEVLSHSDVCSLCGKCLLCAAQDKVKCQSEQSRFGDHLWVEAFEAKEEKKIYNDEKWENENREKVFYKLNYQLALDGSKDTLQRMFINLIRKLNDTGALSAKEIEENIVQ